jgi:hypothetical protein
MRGGGAGQWQSTFDKATARCLNLATDKWQYCIRCHHVPLLLEVPPLAAGMNEEAAGRMPAPVRTHIHEINQ